MADTERSGLLSHRSTSPAESIPNDKVDVKDAGEEDTTDTSRQEKVDYWLLSRVFKEIK